MKLGHRRKGHKGQASWLAKIEGAFIQKKALVGAFSVIVKTDGAFVALIRTPRARDTNTDAVSEEIKCSLD